MFYVERCVALYLYKTPTRQSFILTTSTTTPLNNMHSHSSNNIAIQQLTVEGIWFTSIIYMFLLILGKVQSQDATLTGAVAFPEEGNDPEMDNSDVDSDGYNTDYAYVHSQKSSHFGFSTSSNFNLST